MVHITGNEFGPDSLPVRTILDRAREYAYLHIRGKLIMNISTKYGIRVNRRGLDHTLRHVGNTVWGRYHACSMIVLTTLLREAHHIASEPNAYEDQAAALIAVHRLEAIIWIEGRKFIAHLVVKETRNGFFFYDHRLK